MVVFETERLIVRQYDYELDKENFFRLNGDIDVVRYIRPAKSRGECEVFLKQVVADAEINPLMGRWAVIEKASGNFVGSFAFIPIEGTNDSQLGYALVKEYWGKGFATELMKEGVNHVFTKTSLNEVFGVTEAANIVSQKVLIKSGFTLFKTYKEGLKDLCSYRLVRTNII